MQAMLDEESRHALRSTIRQINTCMRDKAAAAAVAGGVGGGGGGGDVDEQLSNRGLCYLKLGLLGKALKSFDQAASLNPNNVAALYRRGQILVAMDRTQDALACWQSALDASNTSTSIQLTMDIRAAIKEPSKVLQEINPMHYYSSRVNTSLVWAMFALMVLSASYLITNHAFKVATDLALGPSSLQNNGLRRKTPYLVWGPAAASMPLVAPSDETRAATDTQEKKNKKKKEKKGIDGHTHHEQQQHAYDPDDAGSPHPSRAHGLGSPASGHGNARHNSRSSATPTAPTLTPSPPPPPPPAPPLSPSASPPLDARMAVGLAVNMINSGRISDALTIMDSVIATDGRNMGARLARGTARALLVNLEGAVEDFGVAVELEPRYADSWKRLGQARSALGQLDAALADLNKAVELMPGLGGDYNSSLADCHIEIGTILHKKRDYWGACEQLKEAIRLEPENPKAWNVFGMCITLQGHIGDGIKAYQQSVNLQPTLKEAWLNMGMALKEAARTQEAEEAFGHTFALDSPDSPSVSAMFTLSQMRQQLGDHDGAIQILDRAISYGKNEFMTQLLYMRAVCHHAKGNVKEAVRDYSSCLSTRVDKAKAGGEDEATYQSLCFYQREIILYMYHSMDRRTDEFSMDTELQPLFKELWCKRSAPTPELLAQYTYQAPLPALELPPPAVTNAHDCSLLTHYADKLGALLQNGHQGFLPNSRLQRAAGYAAIELAQLVRALLSERRAGRELRVSSEGSSAQGGASGHHRFGWRDAMDVVVKWRQIAEPNDQVIWVDLLTRREFEQGFGSHTPLFDGQTKTVRYYMNFDKALGLQKKVLLEQGRATSFQSSHGSDQQHEIPCASKSQKEALRKAASAMDVYKVLQDDSWVMLPIHSFYREGHMMEGTRFTLSKVQDQREGYKFSIRTPVTPPRWKDFDAELTLAWEEVIDAMITGDRERVLKSVLVYAYFWYNFMPIVRGTAACGYATILSLLWAADMPVSAEIPPRYQVDWEAILSQHPQTFVDSVSEWILKPSAASATAIGGSGGGGGGGDPISVESEGHSKEPSHIFPSVDRLPLIRSTIVTVRERIEALNPLSVRLTDGRAD